MDHMEIPLDDEELMHHFMNFPTDDLLFPDTPLVEPYVEILKQPKQRGYRFRYSSEGNTHGGIPGDDSSKGNKTFPTIQIAHYCGKAAVMVTLVTSDDPPQMHAHNLVGKGVTSGVFSCEETKKEWVFSFPNLGIEHVTKKDLVKVLNEKLLMSHMIMKDHETQSFDINTFVDSFGPGEGYVDQTLARIIEVEERNKVKKEAETLAKNIDLSTVRLCFHAYLADKDGKCTIPLAPAISEPIYDAKAAHAGELRICRISASTSCVSGGQEVFLLCDKVQKEDIAVRFFQEDKDTGKLLWEDYGKFGTTDVYKQSAIVLKTPPYHDRAIQKPVLVNMQLTRKNNKDCSEPVIFTYKPQELDSFKIGAKRRRGLPEDLSSKMDAIAALPRSKTSTCTSLVADQPWNASNQDKSHNTSGIKFFTPSKN